VCWATPENATGALTYATETFCHSERCKESLFLFMGQSLREIPRSARNDKINYFSVA